MFISDDLIFLQLQKTAGTHIAALLMQHLGGRMKGKHNALDFDPGDRLVVGSVRNPWDWYVSLWSYGCSANGGVQGLLKDSRAGTARRIAGAAWRDPARWGAALRDIAAHAGRDVDFWRACYADPLDAAAFRRWLTAILSPEGRALLGADYAARPLARHAGFYTYRMLTIFTPVAAWRAGADSLRDPADIAAFFQTAGAVDMFVRTETLEDDLAAVFARIGRPEITAAVLRGTRTNASFRSGTAHYYDAATRELVARSDPFPIARFGYTFDVGDLT